MERVRLQWTCDQTRKQKLTLAVRICAALPTLRQVHQTPKVPTYKNKREYVGQVPILIIQHAALRRNHGPFFFFFFEYCPYCFQGSLNLSFEIWEIYFYFFKKNCSVCRNAERKLLALYLREPSPSQITSNFIFTHNGLLRHASRRITRLYC